MRGSIMAVAGAVLLHPASAGAQIYCGGDAPVLKVLTYRDGAVLIQTAWRGGDFLQICNLRATWKGVGTETCFAWMSKVAGAVSAGKRTGIWYDVTAHTCATLPTYGSAPAPVYIDVAS